MFAEIIEFETVTVRFIFYNIIFSIKYYYDGTRQFLGAFYNFEGALWQFSTTESPIEMMKNAFYFNFVLPFWSCRKTV